MSHVYDFLHTGNQKFNQQFMIPVRRHFLGGKIKERSLRYVSFNVNQENWGITMSMDSYVEQNVVEKIQPGEKDHELVD